MDMFVTAAVIVAMIVLGVLLIHLLNSRHSEGLSAFHYRRSGVPVQGPASSAPPKARARPRSRRRTRETAE
ncbi:hypothetical protein AB0G67_48025 [Streptomyces sp. NPDC021056]|uniref:hypothetical protein n=1 Tax=Streptomyces sp. NPDC021056 TaxID=3155012 RepID=UPI0033D7D4AC